MSSEPLEPGEQSEPGRTAGPGGADVPESGEPDEDASEPTPEAPPEPSPEPSPEAEEGDEREPQAAPQLQLSKSVSPNPMIIGGEATYTVTVTNTGDEAAEDVEVTDELDPNVSFVSAPGCTASGSTVTCGGAGTTVGAGESVDYTVTVKVDPGVSDGTNITNRASVDASDAGGASTQNIAQTQTMTDVEITKTADPATVNPDGTITYTITVTNHGPSEAVDVFVQDPTDGNLVTITGLPDRCPPSGLTISCDLGTMAPGESVDLTVTVTVDPGVAEGTMIPNCASVFTGSRESDMDNNSSCASTDVGPPGPGPQAGPDLEVDKDGPATVHPDGTAEYTVTVTNTGEATAENVRVVEDFDTEHMTVESLPDQCTMAGDHAECAVGDVAPGETVTLVFVLHANADDEPGTFLDNCAGAGTTTRDAAPRNNAACVRTDVVEDPGPGPSPSPSPDPSPEPGPDPTPGPSPTPEPTTDPAPSPNGDDGPPSGPAPGPDGASGDGAGGGDTRPGLPVTGAGAAALAAAGTVAAGSGFALAWAARRRQAVAADD